MGVIDAKGMVGGMGMDGHGVKGDWGSLMLLEGEEHEAGQLVIRTAEKKML